MSPLKSPVLIIPAFNPDKTLLDMISKHKAMDALQPVIVVNDGSHEASIPIFKTLESFGVILLHHEKNQGKGAALKTGMNYYLEHFSLKSLGVVTADADGQHSVDDVVKLSAHFQKDPSQLYLGVRQIAKSDAPWRSRFGNGLTKFLFNSLTKNKIQDTQTGLRAIPVDLVRLLMTTKTKGYEFEFEMFFIAKKHQVQIVQIPIQTIYLEGNKSSHFNPFWDSLKIYFIFIRFCSVALSSFLLDFSLFSLFYVCSHHPGLAVIGARAFSLPFNFFMNKNFSFKSKENIVYSFCSYGFLALIIVMSSFQVMLLLHSIGINMYFSKVLAEFFLFIINFCLQYAVIFPKNRRFKLIR